MILRQNSRDPVLFIVAVVQENRSFPQPDAFLNNNDFFYSSDEKSKSAIFLES